MLLLTIVNNDTDNDDKNSCKKNIIIIYLFIYGFQITYSLVKFKILYR